MPATRLVISVASEILMIWKESISEEGTPSFIISHFSSDDNDQEYFKIVPAGEPMQPPAFEAVSMKTFPSAV